MIIFQNIFTVVFFAYLICSRMIYAKEKILQKGSGSSYADNAKGIGIKWSDKVNCVNNYITIIIFGGIIIFLLLKQMYLLIFVLFAIPILFERLTGAYISIGIIGNVIKSNDGGKMSFQEHMALEFIAFGVGILEMFNCSEKFINFARGYNNAIISDLLVILVYIAVLFVYIFLICALISTPLITCLKLLRKLKRYVLTKGWLKACGDFFVDRIDKPIRKIPLFAKYIENIIKKKLLLKIIGIFFAPVVCIIDIVYPIILIILSIIISVLGYIILLKRLIFKTFSDMVKWTLSLSDRHLVALSFRIALIVALTITVIFNRYQLILKYYDESTAILEFIASSIVIPVLFEWISSAKQKTEV